HNNRAASQRWWAVADVAEAFPWCSHLSDDERLQFAQELSSIADTPSTPQHTRIVSRNGAGVARSGRSARATTPPTIARDRVAYAADPSRRSAHHRDRLKETSMVHDEDGPRNTDPDDDDDDGIRMAEEVR